MLTALPTPREMADWDRAAIALGVPEMLLMENAAREALHVLAAETGPLRGKKILLFMGGGNNGGDAACLARHLHDAGAEPLVLHTRPLSAGKGVSGRHARLARRCGVAFAPAPLPGKPLGCGTPDIVVDGLLGTGFSGSLRDRELALIKDINTLSASPCRPFVLALDIPSGLSGFTGRPLPEAVRAQATVTFEAAKPGLVLPEAAPFTGRLHIRPIGIPRLVREGHPASFRLLTRGLARAFPAPAPSWHKGRAGRVLIVGGSAGPGGGLTGAPHLAGLAALRAGAGLVSAAAPAGLCAEIKGSCPDLMTRPLGKEGEHHWSPALLKDLLPHLRASDAVVLGPGLGRSAGTMAFVRDLFRLEGARPPLVVDADALRGLAPAADGRESAAAALRPCDVLTPHPGEAALLLGATASRVQEDRFAALAGLGALAPAIWVLKGAGTLVSAPAQPVTVAPFAEPNLAVGGSGDVLSGCLAALLAQMQPAGNETSHLAACLAVLLHAEAGRLLARRFPARGNTATEIADALPQARAALSRPD